MNKDFFIGIDVSKVTLDAALCRADSPEQSTHQQFDNTVPGFGKLLSWLKKQGVDASNSFAGMEHTGHYTLALCCFLQESGMSYTLISPLHLKRSLGLARGKSDRVDAARIAWFICLHQRVLTPVQLPSGCLLKLKNLVAFRDRLVKTSTSLKNTLTDLRETSHLVDNSLIIKLSQKQQKLVEQQIAHIEKEMEATVKQDEELRVYSAVVNCPFLKRNIKVAYTQFLNEASLPTQYKLYFSTDLDLPACMIVKYYRLRYQQEFLIRDAKQFTGLTDCQARSSNKIDYHINAALTAVNVAKVEQGVKAGESFSMADIKTLYHNKLLLDRFISILPKGVELDENLPEIRELYQFGCKAA